MVDNPVFRFAPSPNGLLHLGHAYSALVNQTLASEVGGCMLLRLEDIDTTRCTPALEVQMLDDLAWLGFAWDGEPRRQSTNFELYRTYLDDLITEGLVYRSTLTRSDIARIVAAHEADGLEWSRDPDGASPLSGSKTRPG